MKATRHADAASFLVEAGPELARDERLHSLPLGLALAQARDEQALQPERTGAHPYYAAVSDAGGLVVAAIMTSPRHPLIVASGRADPAPALALLATDLVEAGVAPTALIGAAPLAEAFADVWSDRTGHAASVAVRERLYALTVIQPVPMPAGALRQAGTEDVERVGAWIAAFEEEAHITRTAPAVSRAALERRIAAGGMYLWVDDEPRAMAGRTRPTAHGESVGPVYTPPEWRGRGIATALVAALSQRLLDEGRSFCALFTDLANPTSNAIYQRIGYRPVADFTMFRLEAATAPRPLPTPDPSP